MQILYLSETLAAAGLISGGQLVPKGVEAARKITELIAAQKLARKARDDIKKQLRNKDRKRQRIMSETL